MPIIDQVEYEPEEAIAKGHCPETGIKLDGVNIEDHIHRLWPRLEDTTVTSPQARRRAQLLREYAEKQAQHAPAEPVVLDKPATAPTDKSEEGK